MGGFANPVRQQGKGEVWPVLETPLDFDTSSLPSASAEEWVPSAGAFARMPKVYLHPGEAHLARRPAILKTILGSCVGATFWSPRLRVGALCHGILPRCPEGVQFSEGYRYVDFAIRDLARRLERLGAERGEIEVQLFGGADVLPARSVPSRNLSVGQSNLQMALRVLRDENFNVIASDLGGHAGRTIQFHTWNGQVILRRLAQQAR